MKHKTANGIPIDMDSIRMQNEHVIAAGNAGLNARGDLVGPGGRVIKKAEELAREQYAQQQTQIVTNKSVKGKLEETEIDAQPAPSSKKKNKQEPAVETSNAEVKEVHLPNGDILIVDQDQDPEGEIK